MREVREAEARVRRRQLLVRDDGGDRVHAGAAEALGDGDAEQSQIAEAAEERQVERLRAIGGGGLRLDLAFGEVANQLPERGMLRRRIEGVGHGADLYHEPAERNDAPVLALSIS